MNPFVARKAAARSLSGRALKRRLQPSARQRQRIVQTLKDDAARKIRKNLEDQLGETPTVEPTS